MNAVEHLAHIERLSATAKPGTLRAAMHTREGVEEAERQIAMGRFAWAIERWRWGCHGDLYRCDTAVVFGKSRSDALRRASSPARLGEEQAGDCTITAVVQSGWDEPFVWGNAA